jgi:hypothetical protein
MNHLGLSKIVIFSNLLRICNIIKIFMNVRVNLTGISRDNGPSGEFALILTPVGLSWSGGNIPKTTN